MVQILQIFRSMTGEPDDDEAQKLRPVPLTESPFLLDVSSQSVFAGVDHRTRETITLEPLVTRVHGSEAHARGGSLSKPTSHDPLIERHDLFPSSSDDRARTERERRRPPEWLVSGIFFDLSWTTTFSSLTSNTPITSIGDILSYGVFFSLAWWLWAAQVAYDAKFYSNDWFHRIMLLAQLAVFGSLSAFTKDFNPFSTHVNPKLSKLVDFQQDQYTRQSMLGISGLFSASRLLLAFSYARALYYARKSSGMRGRYRSLYVQIGTCIASSALYGIAAIIVKFDLAVSSVAGKLIFWSLATAVEVASFLWTPDIPPAQLINDDYISNTSERVRTLTTIILGEGVNGVASVLVLAASSIGFGSNAGGSTAAASVIIAFGFLLYFDGWRPLQQHSRRWRVDFLLHFPLHLALIILLEGIKNSLVISSLTSTLNDLVQRESHPEAGETKWNAVEAAMKHLGIDLNATLISEYSKTVSQWHLPKGNKTLQVAMNKVLARMYLSVLEQYQLDGDVRQNFTAYLEDPTAGALSQDVRTNPKHSTPYILLEQVAQEQLQPSLWIPVAAGIFLASMSLLSLVNAWLPKRRYVWISAATRLVTAVGLSLVALFNTNPDVWKRITGENSPGGVFVPVLSLIVMGVFLGQYALDQLIFYIASRRNSRRVAARGRC